MIARLSWEGNGLNMIVFWSEMLAFRVYYGAKKPRARKTVIRQGNSGLKATAAISPFESEGKKWDSKGWWCIPQTQCSSSKKPICVIVHLLAGGMSVRQKVAFALACGKCAVFGWNKRTASLWLATYPHHTHTPHPRPSNSRASDLECMFEVESFFLLSRENEHGVNVQWWIGKKFQ